MSLALTFLFEYRNWSLGSAFTYNSNVQTWCIKMWAGIIGIKSPIVTKKKERCGRVMNNMAGLAWSPLVNERSRGFFGTLCLWHFGAVWNPTPAFGYPHCFEAWIYQKSRRKRRSKAAMWVKRTFLLLLVVHGSPEGGHP